MPIMIMKMYWWDDDVPRWEAAEAAGTLSQADEENLGGWRILKQVYPNMVAMSVCDGFCRVWKEKDHANES